MLKENTNQPLINELSKNYYPLKGRKVIHLNINTELRIIDIRKPIFTEERHFPYKPNQCIHNRI